ncbi:MAG: DoxX family protein [Gemmatimonadota bacterium]|nr:MAG: DoxX family protein [Gemmatimonadota bacterium]
MPEWIFPWMHLASRILFSLFLVVFGLMHLVSPRIAEYFGTKEIPGPRVVAWAMGVMVLVGAVFVAIGYYRFIGAGLIFLALFPAGWALHPFWKETDPAVRLTEMAQFFKVLALAGAALFVAFYSNTVWPLSLGG